MPVRSAACGLEASLKSPPLLTSFLSGCRMSLHLPDSMFERFDRAFLLLAFSSGHQIRWPPESRHSHGAEDANDGWLSQKKNCVYTNLGVCLDSAGQLWPSRRSAMERGRAAGREQGVHRLLQTMGTMLGWTTIFSCDLLL